MMYLEKAYIDVDVDRAPRLRFNPLRAIFL